MHVAHQEKLKRVASRLNDHQRPPHGAEQSELVIGSRAGSGRIGLRAASDPSSRVASTFRTRIDPVPVGPCCPMRAVLRSGLQAIPSRLKDRIVHAPVWQTDP